MASFTERRAQARAYLGELYGAPREGPDACLFVLPGAQALRLPASDLDAVAHEAVQASLEAGVNVYLTSCLLTPESADRGGRGLAEDAAVFPGAWADLDIAGPAHKSLALPPSRDAALELVMAMAVPPTMLVDSGWGLYGWWLLDRPRALRDELARARARRLVRGAQEALRRLAAPRGWTVDPTDDLARVLRIPGTTNWKIPDHPRPVRLLEASGRRYPPEELTDLWGEIAPEPGSGPAGPLPERVLQGHRTWSITSEAGRFRYWNLPLEAAEAAALEFNRLRCDPPLPEAKVRETVRGIFKRYEPGNRIPLKASPNGSGPSSNGQEPGAWAELVPLSTVVRRPVEFVWEPAVVRGGLTLLAGDPGAGKGLVASALAGALTAGVELPGRRPAAGAVLWVTFEENWSYAIGPRLDVAGCDEGRVYRLVVHRPDGEDRRLRVADLPLLRRVLEENRDLVLVVVDPVLSFLGGGVNVNQGNEVRNDLEPFADLADDFGIGLLGIAHVNKSELAKVLYRVSNSTAFVALARSVLGVGKLEDGRRALAQVKANYTAELVPVPFTVQGVVHPTTGQPVGRVVWEEPDESIDVARIFEAPRERDKSESRVQECQKDLLEILGDSPRFAKDVIDELVGRYSESTIRRARRSVGVQVSGGGPNARWFPPDLHHGGGGTEEHSPIVDLTESEARSPHHHTVSRGGLSPDGIMEEGDA